MNNFVLSDKVAVANNLSVTSNLLNIHIRLYQFLGVCLSRAGHEDSIRGVAGFESWGFRDNQHDKWNVCRYIEILFFRKV